MRITSWLVLVGLAATAAQGADPPAKGPGFAQAPVVKAQGEGFAIEFAVGAPTDVAVSVVDASGAVVRHLAAGVLGENAPAPFRKESLRQVLTWDGRDDDGRPVAPAGLSVRVGLGLAPAFDLMIGDDPHAVERPRALAVGPKGEVFVFHVIGALHPSDGTGLCYVYNRSGQYLRSILPYPANVPEGRLAGLRRVEVAPGVRAPFVYQMETRSLLPGAGEFPSHRAVATRDGRVAFVGIHELGRYAQPGPAWLTVIGADGSAPAKALRAQLAKRSADGANLALSPDEKTIYATGLDENKKPTQVVYRLGWDDEKSAVFLGTLDQAGNDQAHFNSPRSVATDAQGNVYVADRGNDRIAVFTAAGAFVGQIPVEKPEMVEVHPRTGAVYVLAGARKEMLHKFADRTAVKPARSLRLPFFVHEEFAPVMALDASADPPVLWVASHHGREFAGYSVLRIEDLADDFGELVDLQRLGCGTLAVGPVLDIGLDRRSERLYLGRRGLGLCLDGRTGRPVKFNRPAYAGSGPTAAVGQDGYLYLYWDYPSATLSRYDLDGNPVPFPARGTNRITGMGSPRLRGRGLAVDQNGDIYILRQKDVKAPGDATDANELSVFGPDGTLKRARLIDSQIRSLNSIQVDRQGNLYLALGLRPGSETLPPGLAGQVPDGKTAPEAVLGVNPYPLLYGSIAKFGPEGGSIAAGAEGVECNFGYANRVRVKGAKWIVPGASPVPSWRTAGTPDVCLCESPRIAVDEFGRVFFPDAGRFRAGVLDTAGNLIAWFGGYGNRDSGGPKSAIPDPSIPFIWPHALVVGDEAVYVADRLAGRVVRAKLAYRAEATVPLP